MPAGAGLGEGPGLRVGVCWALQQEAEVAWRRVHDAGESLEGRAGFWNWTPRLSSPL